MPASALQRVLRCVPSHLQHQHQKLHVLQTRAFAVGRATTTNSVTTDIESDVGIARDSKTGATARSVHKVRSIPKHFNLLAPVDDAGNAIALENARKSSKSNNNNGNSNGVATQEWRHRPSHYNAYRPENKKWWKQMDRVSFRKLLDECMAVGKVSSVLRKVPIVQLACCGLCFLLLPNC